MRVIFGIACLWFYSSGPLLAQSVASPNAKSYTITPPGVSFTGGNQTPVSGSIMKIDILSEMSSFLLKNEGGIWPSFTYTYAGLSKEFTAASPPNSGASPLSTFFALANNNGSTGDIVAAISDCVNRVAGGTCFGGNDIARSSLGGTGSSKLVGREIDMEPAAGETFAAGSIALAINSYSAALPQGILFGSQGGGSYGEGINTENVSFSGSAIHLGNNQYQTFDGSDGSHCSIRAQSGQAFFTFNACTAGYVFQSTSGINWLIIDAGGNFYPLAGHLNLGASANLWEQIYTRSATLAAQQTAPTPASGQVWIGVVQGSSGAGFCTLEMVTSTNTQIISANVPGGGC